jgi:hypothetical protein
MVILESGKSESDLSFRFVEMSSSIVGELKCQTIQSVSHVDLTSTLGCSSRGL